MLELLQTPGEGLKVKVKEGRGIGFEKKELADILGIHTDAHEAITDESLLIKLI